MVLTGATVVKLMRKHKVTLRGLKASHKVTLKRIREVRKSGVSGFLAEDWFRMITGRWPGEVAPVVQASYGIAEQA